MVGRFQKLELPSAQPPGAPPSTPSTPSTPDPACCEHWLAQALSHRRLGRFEPALRDYSRAVEANRASRAGWLGQAQMLIALNECPEARLWARKATDFFPADADLTAAVAQSAARLGEKQAALAASDAAIRLPGNSAYRWLVRAEILMAHRHPLASRCIDKMLECGDTPPHHLEIAEVCIHARCFAAASDHAQRCVYADAANSYGWLLLARCQRSLNLFPAARRGYAACLDLDPANAAAQAELRAMDSLWFHRLRRLLP